MLQVLAMERHLDTLLNQPTQIELTRLTVEREELHCLEFSSRVFKVTAWPKCRRKRKESGPGVNSEGSHCSHPRFCRIPTFLGAPRSIAYVMDQWKCAMWRNVPWRECERCNDVGSAVPFEVSARVGSNQAQPLPKSLSTRPTLPISSYSPRGSWTEYLLTSKRSRHAVLSTHSSSELVHCI